MTKNVFAWTSLSAPIYPEFVSVNAAEHGQLEIAVRGPRKGATAEVPFMTCGPAAAVTLPRNQIPGLMLALLLHFLRGA